MFKFDELVSFLSVMKTGESVKIVKVEDNGYKTPEIETLNDKIRNAFKKAGELLYCDSIGVFDLHGKQSFSGDCYLCYKKEKHIDEYIRQREPLRLYDMLKMVLDCGWIRFTDIGTKYDGEYDIIIVSFETGNFES